VTDLSMSRSACFDLVKNGESQDSHKAKKVMG
jgi:hypothetical protein